MPQKLTGSSCALHERVICATEDSLGFSKRINLIGSRLLPNCEVLDQPITLSVQGLKVPHCAHQFLACGILVILTSLERSVHFCLGRLLVFHFHRHPLHLTGSDVGTATVTTTAGLSQQELQPLRRYCRRQWQRFSLSLSTAAAPL